MMCDGWLIWPIVLTISKILLGYDLRVPPLAPWSGFDTDIPRLVLRMTTLAEAVCRNYPLCNYPGLLPLGLMGGWRID